MKVFILVASDDYRTREIMDVFTDRVGAEGAIKDERYEHQDDSGMIRLISRQSKPVYDIVEKDVI